MARALRSTLPAMPVYLRAKAIGSPGSVDREHNALRGYVVAQKGIFKDMRGEFDDDSLSSIVSLMKSNDRKNGGTKAHFAHPTLSDDGLGKYLGRAKRPRLDGDAVRADLEFSETAFKTPNGNLAGYILDLAESDSNAMSSSLQLEIREEYRLNEKGQPIRDDDGYVLPPIWRPLDIIASDIVDEGAAVDGLLSHDGLPDELHAKAFQMLTSIFPDNSSDVIRSRCLAYLDKYLLERFGETNKPVEVDNEIRNENELLKLRLHQSIGREKRLIAALSLL